MTYMASSFTFTSGVDLCPPRANIKTGYTHGYVQSCCPTENKTCFDAITRTQVICQFVAFLRTPDWTASAKLGVIWHLPAAKPALKPQDLYIHTQQAETLPGWCKHLEQSRQYLDILGLRLILCNRPQLQPCLFLEFMIVIEHDRTNILKPDARPIEALRRRLPHGTWYPALPEAWRLGNMVRDGR